MKYSLFSTGLLAALLLSACATRDPHEVANPDPNHTHADFAVWMDGGRMDFSAPELMSGSSSDESTHDEDSESHDPYLHLHDGIGHVIHRHKPGLSVGDFFASIQIGIAGNCYTSFEPLADGEICGEHPFRMFINGKEVPLSLSYAFDDLDQILFTNTVDDAETMQQVKQLTDDACLYSKRCPWRGEPPAENCIADPKVPCVE
jgi:hypothetical protein